MSNISIKQSYESNPLLTTSALLAYTFINALYYTTAIIIVSSIPKIYSVPVLTGLSITKLFMN